MGKGTIVSGGTGGYYSISVQLDAAAIAARIVDLQARLVDLQSKITDAESTLDELEDDLKKVLNEQDELIDAFAADSTAENLKTLTEKAKEVAAAAAQVGLQRSAVAALVAEEASVRKEITRLSAAPSSVAADAWCADYTEDLAGDVGVVTVPGGERDKHLQILPGYEGGAAYDAKRDGMLRQPYTDSAAATYYNLAMLPGWQKWLPRYRLATITAIDTELDTCSITISPATSGQQGIDVNYLLEYDDVPIEYMSCNSAAFAVEDSVIVEFMEQDKEGIEGNWAPGKPKVIGFETDPKQCLSGALDVGLLQFSTSPPTYPFTVYAGDSVQTYISGPGTETPASPPNKYLLGAAAFGDAQCMVWSDSPPTLSGNNSYDSYAWATEKNDSVSWLTEIASEYTGLMRLYIQSKQGAYRDPKEISPDNILWPNTDGIIRSDDYVYWHLRINGSGATATLLANSEKTECIRSDLASGAFTSSADRKRAESWLLADLTITDPVSQNEVLTAAQVAAVYANGANAVAHGWHYNRAGTQAAIVTIAEHFAGVDPGSPQVGEYFYFSSAQWEITFDTSEVIPTASISNTISRIEFNIEPGLHTIRRPAGLNAMQAFYPTRIIPTQATDEERYGPYKGNVAPLYCFYDSSGSLITKSVGSSYLEIFTPGTYKTGSLEADEGGTFYYKELQVYVTTYKIHGGFSDNMEEPSPVDYGGYWQTFEYTGQKGGATSGLTLKYDRALQYMNGLLVLVQSPCPVNGLNNDPYYAEYQDWIREYFNNDVSYQDWYSAWTSTASAEGFYERNSSQKESVDLLVIIPKNDAEAYYQVAREDITSQSTETETWSNDAVLGTFQTGIYPDGISNPPELYDELQFGLSWDCIRSGGTKVDETIENVGDVLRGYASLSLSSGNYDISQEYDAFDPMFYSGIASDITDNGVPFVFSSFSGDAIYSSQTYPGGVVEWEPGYPAYSTLSGLARWVGWS